MKESYNGVPEFEVMRKGRERWRYGKQGWEGEIRPFLNFGLPDSLYFSLFHILSLSPPALFL